MSSVVCIRPFNMYGRERMYLSSQIAQTITNLREYLLL